MFYHLIKQLLEHSPFFQRMDDTVQNAQNHVQFHNLNQSSKALVVAHYFETTGKNVFLISGDDKAAEEFSDDLEVLLGREHICFFPDFEVLPYEERSPHSSIRSQRTDAMSRAISGIPSVYSMSFRSFLRRVVSRKLFEKNVIHLTKGMEYSPEVLVSDLVGMGYEVEYQVSKICQVARRGGILDIYSPNMQDPVRIEYWGDEIQSIRSFSIVTQRSEGKVLNKVTILPSREFSMHDFSTSDEMWDKIHEHDFYEGIENDISLLFPDVQLFLDYFPKGSVSLFWDEFQYMEDDYREMLEETTKLYEQALAKTKKANTIPKPTQIFADEASLKNIWMNECQYYISHSEQILGYCEESIGAAFQSQMLLNGDVHELEKELEKRIHQGYTIFIQSDNKSQSKRMQELLADYEENIQYTIGVLHKGFLMQDIQLAVYTDHEIFNRYKRKHYTARFARGEALTDYEMLKPGDYIVHIDHGIGIFAGLKKIELEGSTVECIIINYADNDRIYVPTFQLQSISRYVSEEGGEPTINKIGSKKWELTKSRAKSQIELVAEDILRLYAERKMRKGISHQPDTPWQEEMEESFLFEDTPDQAQSSKEIKQDMEAPYPMERLLCGDVGFGKTEVAIRAAFKAVMSGFQVAVLVPTTLLAEQHYRVFRERLAQYPVRIAMFSRFCSAAAMKKDLEKVNQGQVDIAIGTHRLLSADVQFSKLGLLIVDEEHRFGVRHKEKLRKLKANVDTLYMSATPIPRTLSMALSKLKEISLMQTSPKERLPIRTVVTLYDANIVKDAIQREIDRGGQVFYIHNRIQSIQAVSDKLKQLLPNVRFAIAHAQMPEHLLENITNDFVEHHIDVLISTTIIENGIDIPNANTMIVDRADTFGLAQLYQMRGRVGRSNRRAYAYLLIPKGITEDARKRLNTLTEYDYLGAGFQIAMRDLEIRGAGTLLGIKQSGVINSIGFNYYNKLLQQAIENLEKENPVGIWEDEATQGLQNLNVDGDAYLPEEYITDEKERLEIYKRMMHLVDADDFDDLKAELADRFGPLPPAAEQSFLYFRLRSLADNAGLLSCHVHKEFMLLEFYPEKSPSKEQLLQFLRSTDLPAKFDATGNFKLTISFQNKEWGILELLEKGIKNLMYFVKDTSGS
ncbi:MAG TPA: transcription-repair coupling factor [Candidatus Cloacimonadota bacterium]|nr:transcription-repair coupling factor [Candidatus Cloacimonadota bacterium]HPT72364.1 transcription-repair coupling factor [Candidatus Cloacimonadota bacterium]